MRNNNGSKYFILVALLVSVAALTLGFAAFESTLTIKSSADVNPGGNNFKVDFSTSNTSTASGSVTPTVNPTGVTGFSGSAATLNATTISGLKATFTAPGQSVKYSFYAYNSGEFLAYLNSVNIGAKTCTAGTGTTASYVASACNGISISVKVGSQTYDASNTNISSHTLAKNTGEAVEVTIAYAAGSAEADGDFTVSFGDTILTYGSAD